MNSEPLIKQARKQALGDLPRRSAVVYVFGSIALEVAELHQSGPLPPESERITTRHVAFAATPAGRYPRTAAAVDAMAGYISTEQYIWGLRRVLDGIAAGITAGPETPA